MSTRRLIHVTTAALILTAGCATVPREDPALDNIRADLADLRANELLVQLVPQAITEAERAVRNAGEVVSESERAHRILLAEKRIEIARSQGFMAQARQELETLEQERTRLLLRASRLEVEQARLEAEQARLASAATQEEIERTRRDADTAREAGQEATRREQQAREEAEAARRLAEAQATEIELARREAELAAEAAESLRRRLEFLELRETDRGVVITLGDVLFEVGQSELQPGARENLADVVELLQGEPDKRVRIEGHTDSTGPASVNLRLSQQRADAVRTTLVSMGIAADRIQAVGMGEDFPIASNESDDGRARNRRVDVILLND